MAEEARSRDLTGLRIARTDEAQPKKKRAPLWMGATVLIVGVLLALGYALLRPRSERGGAATAATEIEVWTVPTPGVSETLLSGSGYIEAQVRADISAKIPGRLEFLEVEEGDTVRQGQLIAQLENQDYRARSELQRKELAEKKASVAELEANLAEDERDYARQTKLVAEGVTGKADLERAEARRDASRARVETARAAVQSAEGRVRVSEADLDNTQIRAPFTGVVIRKMAKVGEMVMPQGFGADSNTRSGIVQLADFKTLEVEVDVQEANIGRLEKGMPARVTLKSHRDRPYVGILRQVLPTADRAQGTILVRVRITNPDELVLPKMQADVDFLAPARASGSEPPALMIPRSAVLEREGKKRVLVLSGETLGAREIQAGEVEGDRIRVVSGLQGGERIALSPAGLEPGMTAKAKPGGGGR